MLIEIKHWKGNILHTIEADNLRAAVEALIRARANLSGANLSRADFSRANLSRANLSGADFSRANLYGANLSGADFSGANLSRANLSGADFSRANLSGADFSRANLSGANLYGADLSGADFSGANLSRANLSGADFSRANLYGANLSGADFYDLSCLSELSDAIDIAPLIWDEWQKNGLDAAKKRFGLYLVSGEDKALIAMCPLLVGGFCFVLHRREIWWWNWQCPDPETVPVLWRQEG